MFSRQLPKTQKKKKTNKKRVLATTAKNYIYIHSSPIWMACFYNQRPTPKTMAFQRSPFVAFLDGSRSMTGPAGLVAKRAALERCLALRVDGGKLPLGWLQETCWLNFSFQKCQGQWEPIDLGNQRFKEWKRMGNFEGFPVNNSALLFGLVIKGSLG